MKSLQQTSGPKCFGTATRTSFVDQGDKTLPSPNQYYPLRMDNIDNPEWVLGTSENRDSYLEPHRKQYPSPDHYQVNHGSIEKQPKKYSFPESSKSKVLQSFVPVYHPNAALTKRQNPHFSFGYSFQVDYNNKKPGVGDYELTKKSKSFNITQNHFGTGDRPMPYGEQGKNPGATKYNTVDFNQTSKYSFPRTQRLLHQKTKEPKAKIYDITAKKSAPKNNRFYDIKAKKRQTMIFVHNENPSPSHYNIYTPQKIHSGVIEYSKRKPLEHTAVTKYPSPEKYAGDEVIIKNNKGHNFVKEIRSLSVRDKMVPGPGTYQLGKTLSNIGGTIGKTQIKPKQQEPSHSPGANHYRPKIKITKHKAQSTIVFRDNRCDFSKTITGQLGPGAYELKKQMKTSQYGKIGSCKRQQINFPNQNPGVGNYNIPNSIGKLPQYYTSPKKLTQTGYSTFHEKLKHKMLQRQRNKFLEEQREKSEEKEQSEIGESLNPPDSVE